jgi:hypothetical protein
MVHHHSSKSEEKAMTSHGSKKTARRWSRAAAVRSLAVDPAPRYAELFSRRRYSNKWDCRGDEAPPASGVAE